jgi:hypothetical protein
MNAAELIARTVDLCRRMGRPFPAELRAYASDWARQRYDLGWCWDTVKSALRERRALWQVDVEVHRHYARMQAAKDARNRAAGEPLVTTPSPSREAWWDSGASDDVPSPSSVGDLPEDPDGLSPCPKPRQTYRTPPAALPKAHRHQGAQST